MRPLDHSFDNQYVKIRKFTFDDDSNVVKLNNIGLYKDSIVYVKKTPSSKKVIHLVLNNIEYVIRLADGLNIWVEAIDNEDFR